MTVWRSIGGVIAVELTSAEPEESLSAIIRTGIELYGVQHDKNLVCSFTVRRRDFERLSMLCEKRGDTLRVLRKKGLYYGILRLTNRKLLLFGISLILFSAVCLPTRVLFVRVEGNSTIPENEIISAAEGCGIRFGASRRLVRSEKVKNALLDAVPQLQWAGVNTSGCCAVISVRERASSPENTENSGISSIVADRDGYILSTVVTRGTAQVQPGQAVRKGQILISGYTECGICIQATRAQGEIMAQTRRDLNVVTPASCRLRTVTSGRTHRLSLLLGKKRIFFWKGSGIPDTGCDRMYREYYLTLPGGFRLPAALCVDTYRFYDLAAGGSSVTASDLKAFASQYLKSQMTAGQIGRGNQRFARIGDVFQLHGSYLCVEAIGKVRPEQIGEANVKTNGENH